MQQMNTDQRRAVRFRDGTLLLLAGPGSGKTTVLTHRIRELIDSGVRDSDILVITFTKAAATEMQERFLKLIAPKDAHVSFGTFHAIFYQILRHHHTYRKVAPIKDKEKINMLKRSIEICALTEECADFDDIVRTLSLISACKNNGNDPKSFKQDMYADKDFIRLFDTYDGLLRDFGLIDFDDMINKCMELLIGDVQFRRIWQNKFKYILIDEFQDISSNQYALVKLLAYPEYNIFAVGDDDQSIYAFRGASVEMMKRLITEIPGAKQDELSINYRSGNAIVGFASDIISDNKNRFDKHISAGAPEPAGSVSICGCKSREEQNDNIIKLIKKTVAAGLPKEAIAILVRTNRQGAEYAALLRAAGIACAYNDTHIPFSSVYIRDICAYMQIAAGDKSRAAFVRIMNKPLRYIKRDALQSEAVDKDGLLDYYAHDAYMCKRISEMYAHLNRLKTMSPYLGFRYICGTIGYDRYVKDNVSAEKYAEYTEEKEAFGLLIRRLGSYRDVEEMLSVIRGKAAEASKRQEPANGVRIMTYHGSKGLEFDTVILPDVNENKTPSRSAHTTSEIEEERRMFYVAVTRAKNTLRILYRTDENMKVSRFIQKKLHLK